MKTINFQEECLKLVAKELSENANITFKKRWFTFYDDTCGQRGHHILPYKPYDLKVIPNHYVIRRTLSFENEVDKGKDCAILGILNLKECKALSVTDESIEFENFTINFKGNPSSYKHAKYYEKKD